MHLSKSSLSILLWGALCFAQSEATQSEAELLTPEIRRVGEKLACLCKSCKNTVGTCQMLRCGYSHPARIKIAAMLAEGRNDAQIVQSFVKERGIQALAVPPAEGFNRMVWIMPFVALGFGLFAIWLYIRRFRKPVPVPVLRGPDPLARFREEIERDSAKLD